MFPNKREEKNTDPKDTDGVERAERWPVGLDHANMPWSCQLMKKTMNKWWEYQKRSKWALRLFSIAYQTIIPRESHMIHPVTPGPVVKLVNKKITNPLWPSLQTQWRGCKVEHVGDGVNERPEDDGPGGGLVEGDVLVEGNDVVQGCPAQHGDEVPAYGEQDEGDIDVKNEGGSTSDGW
jgi:hypothetical protein